MTIKKPSKSVAFRNEKSNNLDSANKMILSGGVLGVDGNKFFIEYNQGGYMLITKTVYNKLSQF